MEIQKGKIPQERTWNYPFLWLLISLGVLSVLAIFLLPRSYWGDEEHFVQAVRFFGETRWLEAIRDYPEITGPLFYLLYAAWGHVFGFGVTALRCLSLGIAFMALLLLYEFTRICLGDARAAFFACLALLVNPYLLGLSIFVFSDMLTLLFVLACLALFLKGRHFLSSIALCAALLCRQYVILFWASLLVLTAWDARKPERRRESLIRVVYLIGAVLPLLGMMWLWGGIAPRAGRERWIVGDTLAWHPYAFTSYAAFSFLYLLPALGVFREKLAGKAGLLRWALPAGAVYFITGIHASGVTRVQTQRDTVGLAHRGLVFLLGAGIPARIFWYLCVSLGFWVFIVFLRDDYLCWRREGGGAARLLSLGCYAFMLVMPFSFQLWEKYLLLVLPLMACRLALLDAPTMDTAR
jgi:4-amino-4-deoxy-L-arabinose transferase-like glycosyltransferase